MKLVYLAQNRHLLVEWGRNLCLGHKHNQDLPAIEHQKYQTWEHTNMLPLDLVMDSLELVVLMESEDRQKRQFYKIQTTYIIAN